MIRWKELPSKWSGLPDLPMPFSPVHKARKFSTVFGTVSPKRPNTIRPPSPFSIWTSKKTLWVIVSPALRMNEYIPQKRVSKKNRRLLTWEAPCEWARFHSFILFSWSHAKYSKRYLHGSLSRGKEGNEKQEGREDLHREWCFVSNNKMSLDLSLLVMPSFAGGRRAVWLPFFNRTIQQYVPGTGRGGLRYWWIRDKVPVNEAIS